MGGLVVGQVASKNTCIVVAMVSRLNEQHPLKNEVISRSGGASGE